MSLAVLRVATARFVLGNLAPLEMIRLANDLLDRGVYARSLGELVTTHAAYPIVREVYPVFASALAELGVPLPSREAALQMVIADSIVGIAEGRYAPREGVVRLAGETHEASWEHHGKGPSAVDDGYQALIHAYYDYMYFEDITATGQTASDLDQRVAEEATRWVRQHLRVPVDPSWPSWHGGVIARLAQGIEESRRFEDWPVLADALEEAGCSDGDVLEHLRSGSPHVHGCWILDLLLG